MSTATLEFSGPAPAGIEHKAVPAGVISANEKTGEVEVLVSVTGLVDEVKDVIEPGAYAKTLAARRPKGVYSHDWDQPISKTLEVAELMPGDARLPKTTRNGEPWPKEAGALWVKTRFNLGTTRGREAFSDVVFFGEEQEWSIGYNVPVGGARVDSKTGQRHIKMIDLFEYSPVLFGAMPLATTMSVKSAQAAWRALGSKAAVAGSSTEPGDDPLTEVGQGSDTDALAPHVFREVEGGDPDECRTCHLPKVAHEAQSDPDLENPDGTPLEGLGEKGSRAPLDRSPKHNWVEDAGGLPGYIREVARSISEKRGVPLSRAIHIAVGVVQRWARGGGDVDADTRAKAVAAVAEWEKLKATNAARHAGHAAAGAAKALPEDVDAALERFAEVAVKAAAPSDHDTGAMVALYPPPDVADLLAVPNGLPPEDLHVTLAFLGDASAVDVQAVVDAVRATVPAGLTGHVRGLGQWPTPDGDCYYRPIDVPGMDLWRPRLLAALADAGSPASQAHSHSPHMAVSYDDPVSPADAPDIDDVPWDVAVVAANDKTVVAAPEGKDVHTGSVAPVTTGGFGGGPDRPPITRQGMKRCSSCGKRIPKAVRTCPDCGAAVGGGAKTWTVPAPSSSPPVIVGGGGGGGGGNPELALLAWAEQELKVGRVLSAANLAKLKAARDALDAVLAAGEPPAAPEATEEKRKRRVPSRAMTALERVHRIPISADGPTAEELEALEALRSAAGS